MDSKVKWFCFVVVLNQMMTWSLAGHILVSSETALLHGLAGVSIAYFNAKILLLGLNNAGKTTLMHVLRDNRVVQHLPTQHPTSEEIQMCGITFRTFDLGGHELVRSVWRNYFPSVDGVIFLVDSSNPERFPEARKELTALLTEDCLRTVPFVILGNKIDLPSAASEDELRNALGLFYTSGKGKRAAACRNERKGKIQRQVGEDEERPVEVFMCSVIRRMGYSEGFRWLSQHL
ncbi:hypothetical protein Vretifemale_4293 [Volvox reticuliferus]|uniref:Small Arf-related GTPase n=1 Tax=Volvox reticuliferus TaxID=1737510 RepID=A0A8J4C4F4_9CHLO|nr:hypothetical protein Vretifemale_4293 [Volvox reticuliferus]